MTRRSQYAWIVAGSCVALAGCTGAPSQTARAPGDKVRVVAVERVYGDLARQMGGDTVEVTTILNSASADPHAYEPSTRDADAIAMADVVVENGLGYDAFVDKLIAASPRAGRTVFVAGALGGFKPGDNPHVWYDAATLRRFTDALGAEFARRSPAKRSTLEHRRDGIRAWIAAFSARVGALAKRHAGTNVAITEPVFDYVLDAARLHVATPQSFSHAIEEGNDPAPQDVATMRDLLQARRVAALIYNSQTIEPSTTQLLGIAKAANVNVVPITETLPAGATTQQWIDGEVATLERAL